MFEVASIVLEQNTYKVKIKNYQVLIEKTENNFENRKLYICYIFSLKSKEKSVFVCDLRNLNIIVFKILLILEFKNRK